MKTPDERDFAVTTKDGGVHVLFEPTESEYEFSFLADPEDIARHGRLSQSVTVRHGRTGGTGEYPPAEVLKMAKSLAERAAAP